MGQRSAAESTVDGARLVGRPLRLMLRMFVSVDLMKMVFYREFAESPI